MSTPVAAHGDVDNQMEGAVVGPYRPVTLSRSVGEVRLVVDVGGHLFRIPLQHVGVWDKVGARASPASVGTERA